MLALERWMWLPAGLAIAFPLFAILWGEVFKWLDRRWYRKHPGQSRTPVGDAPAVPYEPPPELSFFRGLDADGKPLPPPVKKRWRDILE